MISLLDRSKGSTADYIYRRMNASPTGRIRKLERDTAALRRYLVSAVRVPRGLELGDDRIEVDFNKGSERILLHSSDDSVTIERSPYQNPNVVDLTVTSNAGCTEVVKTITDTPGTDQSATDCAGTLWFRDGNGYICLVHAGSPPDMELMMYWCAPEGNGVDENPDDYFKFPDPDAWAILQVGDECTGLCDEYVVPLWNNPGGA